MTKFGRFILFGALMLGTVKSLPYINYEMKKLLVKRMKKGFTPLPTFPESARKN